MTDKKFTVEKSDEEWGHCLNPAQFNVLRQHGTEPPRSSPLDKIYAPGKYVCAGCEQELFASDTKFDSGTGWPSFYQPLPEATATTTDFHLVYPRTEVHCSQCGGHLGHVFNDGPKPTGQRFCMNGVSLKFVPEAN